MSSFDVIIIGAGAAGLMCAISAGTRAKRVLLLDHNAQAGAKILISGGGRCNFTNTGTTPQNFLSENPHFCRSALSRYTPSDFLALMARHNIAWHEKTLGQLFCDGSARQVVAMLLAECAAAGVAVKLATKVTGIRKADGFTVETTDETHTAPALVLATGGLSIPKMGATGFSYDVAKRFGLKVITPRPALVPLKAKPDELEFYKNLSGVSVPAIATCGTASFRESILFTHRGLSGPAILQISSYWREGQSIHLDLAPGIDSLTFLKERRHARPKAEFKTILAELLPQRLAQAMAPGDLNQLAALLKNWIMMPEVSEGFAKAEVTAGGIDTDQFSSKTMEAKAVLGLYAIGEAVDVTGWLGGYNFQWAWASGWCAGQAV
ncbi:MAG: NAD(P)/FAD-dependent oxidoreductase [Hyphomicrobiales bacterium]|nr:NAD(P)/FAD-dependent oxidoreductase [Hyphomicrobiales bacterium]